MSWYRDFVSFCYRCCSHNCCCIILHFALLYWSVTIITRKHTVKKSSVIASEQSICSLWLSLQLHHNNYYWPKRIVLNIHDPIKMSMRVAYMHTCGEPVRTPKSRARGTCNNDEYKALELFITTITSSLNWMYLHTCTIECDRDTNGTRVMFRIVLTTESMS